MNELFKNDQISFEDKTLYTTKALKKMLPRSLVQSIMRECKSPIQNAHYGAAINQALHKIFMNDEADADGRDASKALEMPSRANTSKQKGKSNGTNDHRKLWFP